MDRNGKETVRLPDINTKPAYDGNYRDKSPGVKAAGKLTYKEEDGVRACMTQPPEQSPPEVVRRFRRTFRPDMCQNRIFYGTAHDPQLRWAEEARHGVNSHVSIPAAELINPAPSTLFQQKLAKRKERDYASHKRAPMGQLRDQRPGLPEHLDVNSFTFGRPAIADEGACYTTNPKKTYAQVMAEAEAGHTNYIVTNKDYHPMERVNRKYARPFTPSTRFGETTNADYSGNRTLESMRYYIEDEKEKGARIVPKRLSDFLNKFRPKVGQPLDPNKDTRLVGPNHVFGRPLKSNGFGVKELMHNRLPQTYLQQRDLQRGLIAAMRRNLKELGWYTYPDLVDVFRLYDKEGTGKIDIDDVRETCSAVGLPVDPWLLEQVLDYCDEERTKMVDYELFYKFLNWKEKLPEGFSYVPYDVEEFIKEMGEPSTDDTTFSSPESAIRKFDPDAAIDAESARIQKEIDRTLASHKTSAMMVNAAVGSSGFPTADLPTLGVPTIRTDLNPPRIRRLGDPKNYGDEATAGALVNPSIYSEHGVYEGHLLLPRTKEELKDIFTNVGVELSQETMDTVYEQVSKAHPEGHVSVESFRNALDDILQEEILMGTHSLAI